MKLRSSKHDVSNLFQSLSTSNDFIQREVKQHFILSYFKPIIDTKVLHRDLLPNLQANMKSLEDIKEGIPFEQGIITSDPKTIQENLLKGFISIHLKKNAAKILLIPIPLNQSRDVSIPEIEFSVVGPKESFVETLDKNLHLVRKRLKTEQLKVETINVGSLTKTKVAVLYLDGIANKENVQTVIQRIEDIDIDQVIDSSFVSQIISDNQNSPFPQILNTERPDRVTSILAEGKIAIIVDGSPHVLICPTTLVEFFSAFEDYFLNWQIASFFRVLRLFAVSFSILITPIYVAVLTHHYELLPKALLGPLIASRTQVPLPPILEAIFLEMTIELLREAGARLPTKVGQTIGIVGGIVIGTAAVEAGLTSNVLLIIVALAALASFTTPVYNMGNTIRIIRFPFLIFAHIWGLLGIALCFSYILTHLLRLTSIGRPFLQPLFPFNSKDLKDAFVRLPFSMQSKRPKGVLAQNRQRFNRKKVNETNDIDE
ncbi:spore germination protein [Salirhabdus salicampi]|uniref:spore germination protein n=1 Tax=Salirhabdus salicampi TaxID=476102 RepID=UPI0020C225E1|nr:spore germination protein [Salirhabdus salicampi]MCP8615597.1 spore germination protein [Salirhabdus salicampi]